MLLIATVLVDVSPAIRSLPGPEARLSHHQITAGPGSVSHTPQGELPRPVAAHEVAGGDRFQPRALGPADGHGIGTPRMEVAARGRVGRVGHLALEDDPLTAERGAGLRPRGARRLGVWMPGR